MQILDAEAVAERLPYGELVDALAAAFRNGTSAPPRSHHTIEHADAADATLLLMPAWRAGEAVGVKIATVHPDNARLGLGVVHASYFLLDGRTGAPRALLDGAELTLRRTACASALASRYLSTAEATTLLMVGTGSLAPHLVRAHAAVRPLERVLLWGRRETAARELARRLEPDGIDIEVVSDLGRAVPQADIVSCATLARDPLVHGADLRDGQHLDLVGAFTPAMREADGEALARARVYVDTFEGAFGEAGDVLQAIDEGHITRGDVVGDLSGLVRRTVEARSAASDITLFKSVGTALEDLAAAELAVRD